MSFSLTPKQEEARDLVSGPGKHFLLRGGSRSGKTFFVIRTLIVRGLKAPGSTHAVLRQHFNHLKHSVIFDTTPKVMKLCWPGVKIHLDKSDWFHELPNGSRLIYGGLDDKERAEKILGQEHSSIFLNEASQISYSARNKALTRLAQNSGLKLREYIDCNPPTAAHWTYRLFFKGLEPTSGKALDRPENYKQILMNPGDNLQNLTDDYIETLEGLPEKEKKRFLFGEYLSAIEGALWSMDLLDRNRVAPSQVPDLVRIVVAVDPSGCSGPEDKRSDEIGIVVVGVDRKGIGYVLDDLSGRYSPEGWGAAAIHAYDFWNADRIVGEINFGGAMVQSTIKAAGGKRHIPFGLVRASRGKAQRAEPVSALYETGKIKHVGALPDLEEQLCNFSNAGYQGPTSPDRADAAVWGLTETMLDVKHYRMLDVA